MKTKNDKKEKIKRKKREKKEKEKKMGKTKSEKKSGRGEKNQAVHGREKGKGRERKRRFSRCSDGRSSIVRELKLVHATRAAHGYRNPKFSSKLQEVGVFSYTSSSLFKSRKWPCDSAQTQD